MTMYDCFGLIVGETPETKNIYFSLLSQIYAGAAKEQSLQREVQQLHKDHAHLETVNRKLEREVKHLKEIIESVSC